MSSQTISPSTALTVSKSLLGVFVFGVTMWYLVTPYIVKPHPQFKADYEKYLLANTTSITGKNVIENWTKWCIYIDIDGENITLPPFKQTALEIKDAELRTNFEWRPDYIVIIKSGMDGVSVRSGLPWYSRFGLYNLFYTENIQNGGIRFMPRFMSGLPRGVVRQMYGNGVTGIPITGMSSESTVTDRTVIQCLMNVVTMAVVFLLYINNPPNKSKEE